MPRIGVRWTFPSIVRVERMLRMMSRNQSGRGQTCDNLAWACFVTICTSRRIFVVSGVRLQSSEPDLCNHSYRVPLHIKQHHVGPDITRGKHSGMYTGRSCQPPPWHACTTITHSSSCLRSVPFTISPHPNVEILVSFTCISATTWRITEFIWNNRFNRCCGRCLIFSCLPSVSA